jgi:hypothetical protein
VQDTSERGGDLVRLERLGEHFTDAGGERLLRQANRGASGRDAGAENAGKFVLMLPVSKSGRSTVARS